MPWQDDPIVSSHDWQNDPVVGEPEGLDSALTRPLAPADAALHVASGMIATPVAGLAGAAAGISNYLTSPLSGGKPGPNPADVVSAVQNGLTYEPRTKLGKTATQVVEYPFQKLAEGADYLGGKVTDLTGSPALGTATNVAAQAIPQAVIGKGLGRIAAVRPVGGAIAEGTSDAAAAARAKTYANTTLGVDWDSLTQAFQQKLSSVAKDATALDNLDPQAVARQARLEALNVPGTRGQITRDLSQLTTEENLTKSDAGAPIRDINAQQDVSLHASLDALRKATGAQAQTRSQVGASVQGALRAKLDAAEQAAGAAYKHADEVGATELIDRSQLWRLNQFLKEPINEANVGWVTDRVERLKTPDGLISVKNLEDVRQELTGASKTGDKSAYYAGKAVGVIDKILDASGSDVYQQARSQWKAMQGEFDKQTRVKALVSEKGYSTERAVALEDTLDAVLRSPTEEIVKVKDSLLNAKTSSQRTSGLRAWRDIQGGVIDKLKEAASGRRAVTGENEQLQFNASFRDVFNELEKDGKIDAIFSPEQATQLRLINKVVEDVRTKPAGRISGSDTMPRILNMLDKISKIPLVGDITSGTVKAVQKVRALGAEDRLIREAQRSPLDEAVDNPAPQRINDLLRK